MVCNRRKNIKFIIQYIDKIKMMTYNHMLKFSNDKKTRIAI